MNQGRVAVVTGGTKGIGLAVAREIAGQHDVLLLAHRSDHGAAPGRVRVRMTG